MNKSPCKNCQLRYLGCHEKCTSYRSYKEEIAKEKKFNNRHIQYKDYICDKIKK